MKGVESQRYGPRAHSIPDFSANVSPAMCRALDGEVWSAETCSEEERPIELLGVPWRAAIERTQEIMERFHKEFCEKEAERARQNKKVPDIYSSGGRGPEREPFLLPQNVQKIEQEEVA